MIFKCVLAVVAIVGAASAKVEVKTEWKPNHGWEVTCTWHLRDNDSLQSVKLYRNDHQYAVFRPEVNGQPMRDEFHSPAFDMKIECGISSGSGRGRCVTSLQLLQEATDDEYACEVSGERPTFYEDRDQKDAFVPPSVADIKMNLDETTNFEVFNCSSAGIPAPKLVWTVDGRKLPVDMTTSTWSKETKLWHSWSVYTGPGSQVSCLPEADTKNRQIVNGLAITVSHAAEKIAVATAALTISALLLPLL